MVKVMGQSELLRQQDAVTILQLDLSSESSSGKESLCLEFTHAEISSFFDQLDVIQSQIDSLC